MKKQKKLIACLIVSIMLFAYVPAVFASDLAPFVVSGAQSLLSTDFAWDTTKYPDSLTTSTEYNTRVALSKEWGFTYGAVIGSGRSLDRANGLGGKAADDTSVKITGNSSSVDIYLEKEFNGGNGYTEGVVTLKFKLWSDSNQYLKLRCGMDGLVKDLWIAASTNEWTEHSVVLDLDNEAAYYDSNANPADLESNVLKRFRFIMCPGDGKSIALDDLSIDYCKPGEETVSENTVTFSGTAQKGSTVKAYVNGVLNNSCTVSCRAYSITADGLASGDNTVVIEVQAPGGGVSSYTKTINFVKEITVSPADGEYISEVPRCFNAVCQDAETIVFELDGRMLGEADAEGNVRAPESLDYGNHSLKLTAIFADGSACIRETSFNYYQKVSYSVRVKHDEATPVIEAFTNDENIVSVQMPSELPGNAVIKVVSKKDENVKNYYVVKIDKEILSEGPEGTMQIPIVGVEASDIPQPENSPENSFDGSLDSRWSAQGKNHIIYDLGSVKNVSYVGLAVYNGNARKQYFDIYTSKDGVDFEKVYSGETSGTTVQNEVFAIKARDARYVKIACNGTSVGDWNSITEAKIYGK